MPDSVYRSIYRSYSWCCCPGCGILVMVILQLSKILRTLIMRLEIITVSLTITTAAGCSNTLVKPAYIKIQPVTISLNVPAGGCIPFTYTPQATIQTLDPVVSYQWDLGEPGAVFNVQNPPPYTYTTAGSFTISLTVTTVSGCIQTVKCSRWNIDRYPTRW